MLFWHCTNTGGKVQVPFQKSCSTRGMLSRQLAVASFCLALHLHIPQKQRQPFLGLRCTILPTGAKCRNMAPSLKNGARRLSIEKIQIAPTIPGLGAKCCFPEKIGWQKSPSYRFLTEIYDTLLKKKLGCQTFSKNSTSQMDHL